MYVLIYIHIYVNIYIYIYVHIGRVTPNLKPWSVLRNNRFLNF